MKNVVRLASLLLCTMTLTSACAGQQGIDQNRATIEKRSYPESHIRTVQEEPEIYGQWGKLGMDVIKSNYPNAQLVDYAHIGRQTVGRQAIETFRYELRQDGREWTVQAAITIDPQTNKLVSIHLR